MGSLFKKFFSKGLKKSSTSIPKFINQHVSFANGQLGPEADSLQHATPYQGMVSMVLGLESTNPKAVPVCIGIVEMIDDLPHVSSAKEHFNSTIDLVRRSYPNISDSLAASRTKAFSKLESARYSCETIIAAVKYVSGITPKDVSSAYKVLEDHARKHDDSVTGEAVKFVSSFIAMTENWEPGRMRP